jgi:hypothetical protein
MEKKDKISMALSTSAFALSLLTAFVTTALQQDNIKATIQGDISADINPKGNDMFELLVFSDQTLTVANLGNRSAALTVVELHVLLTTDVQEDFAECGYGDFVIIPYYQFVPSSLKPGEVLVLRLKVNGEAGWETTKDWLRVGDQKVLRDRLYYKLCASFSVVTPRALVDNRRVVLEVGYLEKDGNGKPITGKELPGPFILAEHFGTIFW